VKNSANSPPAPGKAISGTSNSGMFDNGIPSFLFNVTFISLSLTATSPFSSESLPRDAQLRPESLSAPRPINFWMSFDLAPTRLQLCARGCGTVGSVCDSRVKKFLECQYRPKSRCADLCITGTGVRAAFGVAGSNKNPGIAAGVLHFVDRSGGWIRNPCRPCRRPEACRRRLRHPSSAVRRSWLRW
jgi:hypothetical protein